MEIYHICTYPVGQLDLDLKLPTKEEPKRGAIKYGWDVKEINRRQLVTCKQVTILQSLVNAKYYIIVSRCTNIIIDDFHKFRGEH